MRSVIWLLAFMTVLWLVVVFDTVPESIKKAARPWCRQSVKSGAVNVTTGFYSRSHYEKSQRLVEESTDEKDFRRFANSEYRSEMAGNLEFEDAEKVLLEEPGMLCRPEAFGYTMTESEKIFPYKGYPRCDSTWNQTFSSFDFSPATGLFSLRCKSSEPAYYQFGPVGPLSFPLQEEQEVFLDPKRMENGEVKLRGFEDFVVARCGKDGPFDIVKTAPIYKPRRHQEAQKKLPPGTRPKIIMMLVLDSFSRRHFYQKLPNTIEYLRELNRGSDYSVFDFKFHNVAGDGSVQNTIPIFSSHSGNADFRYSDMLSSSAIWQEFKESGFMSAMYFEGCDQMFPDELGRNVDVDHLGRQFMCTVGGLGEYTSVKQSSSQRCVGPHMAHVYGFQYVNAFSRMYFNASQFIYHHYEAAHEGTGLHAETIDIDLRDYLRSYLKEFGPDYDIVIYLQADHGMR